MVLAVTNFVRFLCFKLNYSDAMHHKLQFKNKLLLKQNKVCLIVIFF